MPFIPMNMTALMLGEAGRQTLSGAKLPTILSAISSAVCSYFSIAPIVVSMNNVMGPGAGSYTGGILGLVPRGMSSLMMLKATSAGIVGRDIIKLFNVVSFGVCNTLQNSVKAQGVVIGGGPGKGVGKIINLVPSVLHPIIDANIGGRLLFGSKTSSITGAMAFGICTYVMTAGTINTNCIGAAAPPPAGPVPILAAPGPGRLI